MVKPLFMLFKLGLLELRSNFLPIRATLRTIFKVLSYVLKPISVSLNHKKPLFPFTGIAVCLCLNQIYSALSSATVSVAGAWAAAFCSAH